MPEQKRQPKGIPAGGEFAKNDHGDAPVTLSGASDGMMEVGETRAALVRDPEFASSIDGDETIRHLVVRDGITAEVKRMPSGSGYDFYEFTISGPHGSVTDAMRYREGTMTDTPSVDNVIASIAEDAGRWDSGDWDEEDEEDGNVQVFEEAHTKITTLVGEENVSSYIHGDWAYMERAAREGWYE